MVAKFRLSNKTYIVAFAKKNILGFQYLNYNDIMCESVPQFMYNISKYSRYMTF